VEVLRAVMPPVREERLDGHLLVWVIRRASAVKSPSKSGLKHCLGLASADSLDHLTPPIHVEGNRPNIGLLKMRAGSLLLTIVRSIHDE
jgi:hypothetical protein